MNLPIEIIYCILDKMDYETISTFRLIVPINCSRVLKRKYAEKLHLERKLPRIKLVRT